MNQQDDQAEELLGKQANQSNQPLDQLDHQTKWRRYAWKSFKLILLIVLVSWAHQQGLLIKTLDALKPLAFFDALGAFLALGATLICGVIRWRWILRGLHLTEPSFGLGLRLYYEGLFYNTFAPGAIGGDVLRAHWLRAHDQGDSKLHYLVTLGERGMGLATLGVLGMYVWGGMIAAFGFISLGCIMIILLPRCHETLRLISPQWIIAASFMNVVSHLISFIIYLSLARSLGISLPFFEWFEVLTITILAANLPLSIGGIGPREAALISLLGNHQVDGGAALALSLGTFATLALHALLGGLVHLLSTRLNRRVDAR